MRSGRLISFAVCIACIRLAAVNRASAGRSIKRLTYAKQIDDGFPSTESVSAHKRRFGERFPTSVRAYAYRPPLFTAVERKMIPCFKTSITYGKYLTNEDAKLLKLEIAAS